MHEATHEEGCSQHERIHSTVYGAVLEGLARAEVAGNFADSNFMGHHATAIMCRSLVRMQCVRVECACASVGVEDAKAIHTAGWCRGGHGEE